MIKSLSKYRKQAEFDYGDVKEAAGDLDAAALRRITEAILKKTPKQIEFMVQSPDTSILEMSIASIVYKALKLGDPSRLGFLIDRVVGKVGDKSSEDVINVRYVTEVQEDGSLIQSIYEDDQNGK